MLPSQSHLCLALLEWLLSQLVLGELIWLHFPSEDANTFDQKTQCSSKHLSSSLAFWRPLPGSRSILLTIEGLVLCCPAQCLLCPTTPPCLKRKMPNLLANRHLTRHLTASCGVFVSKLHALSMLTSSWNAFLESVQLANSHSSHRIHLRHRSWPSRLTSHSFFMLPQNLVYVLNCIQHESTFILGKVEELWLFYCLFLATKIASDWKTS